MLSESRIEEVSRTLTDGNRGHAEKLYLQDIILSTISRETVDELVFKGGTALLKFYQLDRFSEDLDFSKNGEIDLNKLLDKIERDLENFGAEVQEKKIEDSERNFKARLGIKGPLYSGERRTLSFIRIEINKKSGVEKIDIQRYTPRFQDITAFELPVLTQEEILAEKIRAIRTREKPRDLYDIYHLLNKKVEIDEDLVSTKLDYYDLSHDKEATLESAKNLEKNWDAISALTYSKLPGFQEALETLKKGLE
ncbi:MAG: nucleotidyl transferase AbiEii/AbiGii toxin family protein [Candidatus Nanohaloarchaea archaeon]